MNEWLTNGRDAFPSDVKTHKGKTCIAFANGCLRAEAEIALFSQYLTSNGYLLKDQP